MARSKGRQQDNPATIRKGIYISALVYIEGDQAPAADFATSAKSALKAALAGDHDGLTMTVKNLEVKNNVEDEQASDGGKESKFEF
jgi:hypothetical protein